MGHANIYGDDGRIVGSRPCTRNANQAQDVCRIHGGSTKQAKAAAEARRHSEELRQFAGTLGAEPDTDGDAIQTVAEQIAWGRAHVKWLRRRVQAVDPDALVWGITKETEGDVVVGNGPTAALESATGTVSEAKPNAWLSLYLRASRELEKLCLDSIRVGVELRRQEMDERMAERWAEQIDAMLTSLGHDPNDPATAAVVERHLRAV